jgi:hypothetical protein
MCRHLKSDDIFQNQFEGFSQMYDVSVEQIIKELDNLYGNFSSIRYME